MTNRLAAKIALPPPALPDLRFLIRRSQMPAASILTVPALGQLAGRPGLTPRSIRRIVKEVASRNSARNPTADALAAVVYAVRADAVQ